MSTETIKTNIAALLLKIGAIKLSIDKPYTWASGWKSPIYCDNRLSLSFPEIRSAIKRALVESIKQQYTEVACIAGVATAGIPQGALVADELGLPFVYVRSKPKGHGMTNSIEGKITKGQKVVVLEDLVSTGGSSLKATNDLRQAGFDVLGMAAIFTYGFDIADKNFEKEGVKLVCLSDYHALIEQALASDYIRPDQLETLKAWRENPAGWSYTK